MLRTSTVIVMARGALGAAVGGVAGYFVFGWILGQGFYALVLPGAFVGLGCGYATRRRSTACGVMSAVVALALGTVCEARFRPFIADDSFQYFITHMHKLTPVTLIMLALGTMMGYWFGVGRERL